MLQWLIGLFEGEGTIIIRQKEKRGARLKLVTTDFDIIDRFHEAVGCGTVRPHKTSADRKDAWVWQASAEDDVRRLLIQWLPYLGMRRAHKALDALDWLDYRKLT